MNIGLTPYESKRISKYLQLLSNELRAIHGKTSSNTPTYQEWKAENALCFEIRTTRSAIWNLIDRARPKTRGPYYQRRYDLHCGYFGLIDNFFSSASLLHLKSITGKENVKFSIRQLNGSNVEYCPTQTHSGLLTEGEMLLGVMGEFKREAKPITKTIRFLDDRCVPLIEKIMAASRLKGQQGNNLTNGNT